MDEKLKDILSNLNPGVDQDTLLQYLQGKLSAEQQHEVEKSLVESDFESEAWEGLNAVKDKKQVTLIVDQLNRDLKKKTDRKKSKKKRQLKLEPWLIIVVVTILALVVLSYMVIHLMMR